MKHDDLYVCEYCHTQYSTFSDWKTGKSKPKIKKLKKIAEYFQIPITELI